MRTPAWLWPVVALQAAQVAWRPLDPNDPRWAGFDLHRYAAMASGASVRQPECFRVAAPLLASALGWRLLSLVALGALLAALWKYLKDEVDPLVPMIAFVACRPVAALLWDPWQAGDTLGLVALVLALWAVRERRWQLFACSLGLGGFAREWPLLAVPVALQADPRSVRWAVPGLAVFVGLRLAIEPAGGVPLWEAPWVHADKWTVETALRLALLSPALALVSRPRAGEGLLLAGAAAAFCFGGDVERLALPALPVVVLLAGRTVQGWSARARTAAAAACLVASVHHEMGLWSVPREVTIGASALALLLVIGLRLTARGTAAFGHGSPS